MFRALYIDLTILQVRYPLLSLWGVTWSVLESFRRISPALAIIKPPIPYYWHGFLFRPKRFVAKSANAMAVAVSVAKEYTRIIHPPSGSYTKYSFKKVIHVKHAQQPRWLLITAFLKFLIKNVNMLQVEKMLADSWSQSTSGLRTTLLKANLYALLCWNYANLSGQEFNM